MSHAPPATIDLGELDGPPAYRPSGTRPYRRSWLGVLMAATTALCLSVLAGATIGTSGLGEPLWTRTVSRTNGLFLGSATAYTVDPTSRVLSAWELSSGRLRWELAVPDVPANVLELGQSVAVLTRMPAVKRGPSSWLADRITFVDAGTGRVLNEAVGGAFAPGAPGLPVVLRTSRSGCEPRRPGDCFDLTGYDPSTAQEVWRVPLTEDGDFHFSVVDNRIDGMASMAGSADPENPDPGNPDTDTLVGANPAPGARAAKPGLMTVYDMRTGEVRGRVEVPDTFASGRVELVGDRRLTSRRDGTWEVLTAYEMVSTHPIWTTTVEMPPLDLDTFGAGRIDHCGAGVCLYVGKGIRRLIDLETGALSPDIGLDALGRIGPRVFVAGSTGAARPEYPKAYVVDWSGQVLTSFGYFEVISWTGNGGRALISSESSSRTGFYRVDATGLARSLGSVRGTLLRCQATGDYLACADLRGTARVWRQPHWY
jgi:hypothetical protein